MTDDHKPVRPIDIVAAKFAQDCETSGYEPKKDTTVSAYYRFIQASSDEPLPDFISKAYGIEKEEDNEANDD